MLIIDNVPSYVLLYLLEEKLLFSTECLTTIDSIQQCNQRTCTFYHINSSLNNVIVICSPYSKVSSLCERRVHALSVQN